MLIAEDYTLNPFRMPGLVSCDVGGIPLFYAETTHDAELIAQIILAAQQQQTIVDTTHEQLLDELALTAAQDTPGDAPSDNAARVH